MVTRCFVSIFLALFVAWSATGCGGGGGDKRASNVVGTVTYKGAPVPRGSIQFRPVTVNGGPAGFADIVDGMYDTSQSGKGVDGGKYDVLIIGYDGNANPAAELPMGEPLFSEYKVTVDIAEGQKVTQDFDVPPQ